MQTLINITDIHEFMIRHVLHVFDTIFSMKAVPINKAMPGADLERVCGSVGFGGEAISGAVYLHLPARFAALLAACMLGVEPQSLSEAEINDVVGELGNMLTGGLKSWLGDSSLPCAVSIPAVIRGSAFAVELLPDVERLRLEFNCGPNYFSIEVHVKFQ